MLNDQDLSRHFTPPAETHRPLPTHGGYAFGRSKQDDLAWWTQRAAEQPWKWASTYEGTAPHWYIPIEKSTLTREEYARAVRIILTWGQPERFGRTVQPYLYGLLPVSAPASIRLDDGRWPWPWPGEGGQPQGAVKWWCGDTEGKPVRTWIDVALINVAVTPDPFDYSDGLPPLPRTEHPSGREWPTDYDALDYDIDHPLDKAQGLRLRKAVREAYTDHPAWVLDVGAGTGRGLDHWITAEMMYTALEPSQAMLTRLVGKHPNVAGVVPFSLRELLHQPNPYHFLGRRSFDIVTCIDTAHMLEPGELAALGRLSHGAVVIDHQGQTTITRGRADLGWD